MFDLESLKRKYGLSEWSIAVRQEGESTDGSLGEAHIQTDWREATIYLYTNNIIEHSRRYPNETVQRTLEHELCEVAVAEEMNILPEHITEHPDFMRFRDRMAERLRQLVERAVDA